MARPAPRINIGIDESDRAAIAGGLSKLLADTYTLYLTTHNFHWNVTGPMFNTLHLMFMGQYTELWNAVDPVAERIRSLGHPAPGSYSQFGKLSSIKDAFNPKEAAHLDVPAGKYVVVSKADVWSEDYDVLGFVVCTLVAGVDTDTSSTRGDSALALTVVHGFADPARIALRCVGFGSKLRHAKITAIRVDVLKNVHVEAG